MTTALGIAAPCVCPTCGREVPKQVGRFGLTIESSPPTVRYKGRLVPLTSAVKVRMLWLLCGTGRATNESLAWRPDGPAQDASVKVHISQLREILTDELIPIRITHVDGYGYILQPITIEQVQERAALRSTPTFKIGDTGRVRGANAVAIARFLQEQDQHEAQRVD